jgi:glutathione peroxidase-family protein
MKGIIAYVFLLIGTHVMAQDTIRIYQQGFGKNADLTLLLNGGRQSLDTSKELVFDLEGNVNKPYFGQILKPNGRYAGFFIEPGATTVTIKKRGFPSSVEVPGSKTHALYQSINYAKNAKAFESAVLANINDTLALQLLDTKFKFEKLKHDKLQMIYDSIAPENRSYTPVLNAFLSTYDIEKINIGAQIYDFTGEDRNGNSFNTKDYRGKYLLLDFANTGCGPCWAGYPDMIEVTSQYDNLQVITYNEDDNIEGWKELAEEREIRLEWPVLWYGKNKTEIFEIYNVEGWPLMFLISPEGEVLDAWYGSAKSILVNALQRHLD